MKQSFVAIFSTLLVSVSLALLVGCTSLELPTISAADLAQEREFQLTKTFATTRKQTERIHNLIYPLLLKNTHFCEGLTRGSLGIAYATPHEANQSNQIRRNAREAVYGFDDHIVIFAVADDSAAAKAGIQVGDKITRIGYWQWSRAEAKKFNKAFPNRVKSLISQGSVPLTVKRMDSEISVDLVPAQVCAISVRITTESEVQARTDGRNIQVTMGLTERLDDEQIRTILAHEVAHCALNHVQRSVAMTGVGLAVDLALLVTNYMWLGGQFSRMVKNATSIGMEREADYLSMYLLANAGFETGSRSEIWRKLADEVSFTASLFKTHPYSPERFLLLNKTHDEITRKLDAGEPLLPEGV